MDLLTPVRVILVKVNKTKFGVNEMSLTEIEYHIATEQPETDFKTKVSKKEFKR